MSNPLVTITFWRPPWDRVSYIPTQRDYGNNENCNEYNNNRAIGQSVERRDSCRGPDRLVFNNVGITSSGLGNVKPSHQRSHHPSARECLSAGSSQVAAA